MSSPSKQLISVYDAPSQVVACDYADRDARVNREAGVRKMPLAGVLIFTLTLLWCVGVDTPADSRVHAHWAYVGGASSLMVGTPMVDSHGVAYYPVMSAYQGSQTQIVRVLEPTHPAAGKPPRLLYVLPVDAGVDRLTSRWGGRSSRWGDGLEELRRLDVANRFNMTLIAPSFTYEPWYGDNDTDQTRRMESFVVNDLVPFGDTFAHGAVPQRLLIGFSKSGTGALILILRHPAIFQAAAVWDSPAQLSEVTAYPGLLLNFGTQKNFDRYYIPALISNSGDALKHQNRLWISGDQAFFTPDMIQLHKQLTAASIPHTWATGNTRIHHWQSGWLDGAVVGLDAITSVIPPNDHGTLSTHNGQRSAETLAVASKQ
jgi:S-formylglutathione hydrolase FrmB